MYSIASFCCKHLLGTRPCASSRICLLRPWNHWALSRVAARAWKGFTSLSLSTAPQNCYWPPLTYKPQFLKCCPCKCPFQRGIQAEREGNLGSVVQC